jgi:hypothetical protein
MKQVHEMIDDDDLEIVLDDYAARCDAPTLNDYFSVIAYPKTTKLERDAALVLMRRAWIAALHRRGVKLSHARGYILRQEFYVRENMNGVDDLPVSPLPWNPHWPVYTAR